MLKTEELKKLDVLKLMQECHKAKKELFTIKFKVKTSQSKEIHKVKKLKKYIARIKTLQVTKEREQRERSKTPLKNNSDKVKNEAEVNTEGEKAKK